MGGNGGQEMLVKQERVGREATNERRTGQRKVRGSVDGGGGGGGGAATGAATEPRTRTCTEPAHCMRLSPVIGKRRGEKLYFIDFS